MNILEHFGEDAFGRDGHGHASESKETLYEVYNEKKIKNNRNRLNSTRALR